MQSASKVGSCVTEIVQVVSDSAARAWVVIREPVILTAVAVGMAAAILLTVAIVYRRKAH